MRCPRCHSDNPSGERFCAACGAALADAERRIPEPPTQTLSALPGEIVPGTALAGRFQILEELGRGGMGRVWKAFDAKVGEAVAVKVIRPEIAGDRRAIGRFLRELRQARRVSHPNVCRMFDLGEDGALRFMTMEYVPGVSLKAMIRERGRLNAEEAAGIGRQIAAGLAEAHRLGIIHRDLKPQNIMVTPEGAAKIMDFGIARAVQTGEATVEGAVVGTPAYMAPEQAAGKPADARSDIYALGIVLYEMVMGRVPFKAGAPLALAMDLPGALSPIILRCLENDPDRRFQTAGELNDALAGKPLGPAGLRTGRRLGMRLARKPGFKRFLWAGGAILALSALAALLFLAGGKGPRPEGTEKAGADFRLAVLPLRHPAEGQERGILAAGMTEDLRMKLSRAGSIKLISASSSDRFMDSDAPAAEIGKALDASHILTGAMTLNGDRMAVKITLRSSPSGETLLDKTYEGAALDYFSVKDRIVADTVRALQTRVSTEAMTRTKKREPSNLEAFKDYRLGRFIENRYRNGEDERDFEDSFKAYQEALTHDPRYALAFCGLGDLHEARFVKADRFTDLASMLRYYQEANGLDPDLAETQLGMGWSYFYQEDMNRAASHFALAVELDPDNASVVLGAGAFLRSIGFYDKALPYLEQAMSLDPLSLNPAYQTAACLWFLGKYEKGIGVLRDTFKVEPGNPHTQLLMASHELMRGNIPEARALLAQARSAPSLSDSVRRQSDRIEAWILAARGEKELALDLARTEPPSYTYEIVNVYCLLGMKEEALSGIRAGQEKGFRLIKDYMYAYPFLLANPLFKVLRSEAPFAQLLKESRVRHENLSAHLDDF